MHAIRTILSISLICFVVGCQTKSENSETSNRADDSKASTNVPTKIVDQVVETSCGQCQFSMDGSGCDLAVRIDGQSYYVDGSSIDDHGDAHGSDGLCNCVRKAKVTGEIKEGRFVATSFEVLPDSSDQ